MRCCWLPRTGESAINSSPIRCTPMRSASGGNRSRAGAMRRSPDAVVSRVVALRAGPSESLAIEVAVVRSRRRAWPAVRWSNHAGRRPGGRRRPFAHSPGIPPRVAPPMPGLPHDVCAAGSARPRTPVPPRRRRRQLLAYREASAARSARRHPDEQDAPLRTAKRGPSQSWAENLQTTCDHHSPMKQPGRATGTGR